MTNLAIMTPRALFAGSTIEWNESIGPDTVLFTGGDTPEEVQRIKAHAGSAFERIDHFPRYDRSARPELAALELHARQPLRNVFTVSEVDVQRAARIRKRCGILGFHEGDALYFRDKYLMKQRARERGLRVPAFAPVENAIELIDFIRGHGYPVVVKPRFGLASIGVKVLRDHGELATYLDDETLSGAYGAPGHMVEAFVNGVEYRVDGLYAERELVVLQSARYVAGTLDFLDGRPLVTLGVSPDCNLYTRIRAWTRRLLEEALPSPATMAFHIQLFHEIQSAEVILCQVPCRPGGG